MQVRVENCAYSVVSFLHQDIEIVHSSSLLNQLQSMSIDKLRQLFPPPTNQSSSGGGVDIDIG